MSVIKNYSRVGFDIARKNGVLIKFLDDIKLFLEALSPSILRLLNNPTNKTNDLRLIIKEVCQEANFNCYSQLFIEQIVLFRRANYLKKIYDKIISLHTEEQNILQVTIFTSTFVNSRFIKKIEDFISSHYPSKKIKISQTINREILGGIVINFDSKIIDLSDKKYLSDLSNNLYDSVKL